MISPSRSCLSSTTKNQPMKTKLLITLSLTVVTHAYAGSATWNLNPTSSDWNTTTNWTPATVPNGPTDVATFGVSNIPVVDHQNVEVNAIVFEPGASSFTISSPLALTMSGAGISNNSGVIQIFENEPIDFTDLLNPIVFSNDATAGELTQLTAAGGDGDQFGGEIHFLDSSTAGSSALVASPGRFDGGSGQIRFEDSSFAGNATITIDSGPTAGDGGGSVVFLDSSNAGNAVIAVDEGGSANFVDSSSATHATISCGGATGGGSGAILSFSGSSSASHATLIVNGGTGGGEGGRMLLWGDSNGETARVKVLGNGMLDIGGHNAPGATIGSLEGTGNVQLTQSIFEGERNLTIGSNNLNTTFSGIIADAGPPFPTAGSISKVGTGTLTLTGPNLYAGGTTVSQGALVVSNQTGSGTGTGAVSVDHGTLGGNGIIGGAVTVRTGSFLAPAIGSKKQVTLTLQSSLTLQAAATYTYSFKARNNEVRTDLLIANGVSINGAKIKLKGKTQGTLTPGTVITVISNTSASPISGTFSNLFDGSTITIGNNTFQADYEGGDGNDLTLTVVQ